MLARAVASSNRAIAEVAAEYGAAWGTAHRALVAAAAQWLPGPATAVVYPPTAFDIDRDMLHPLCGFDAEDG